MDINKIKTELLKQKESKFKGNIYHYSQTNFSYNSNKIEGSRLTSEQTEAIFDTSSIITKSNDLSSQIARYIEMLNYKTKNIEDLGVTFVTNTMVGKDITIDQNLTSSTAVTVYRNGQYTTFNATLN